MVPIPVQPQVPRHGCVAPRVHEPYRQVHAAARRRRPDWVLARGHFPLLCRHGPHAGQAVAGYQAELGQQLYPDAAGQLDRVANVPGHQLQSHPRGIPAHGGQCR